MVEWSELMVGSSNREQDSIDIHSWVVSIVDYIFYIETYGTKINHQKYINCKHQ